MKIPMIVLSIAFLVIALCVPFSYAACPLEPSYGPYATVQRLMPGKTKIVETWECIVFFYKNFLGNGICFKQRLNNTNDYQDFCITGEYRIETPINSSMDQFFLIY